MNFEKDLPRLLAEIDRLLARKARVTVGIDGSCTAGKTTLAGKLQEHYGCIVIHMDDFFLRPHQRTPERYNQPGGNVDYERFCEEVLLPLGMGTPFSYRPFDCKAPTLSQPVRVSPGRLTVIEGSYSHHPHFCDPYDLKVFLMVTPEVQRQRILRRPAALHERFFSQWIPMENRYFETFGTAQRSDFVF